jgi:predicted DNA-binding transcriptional regulator AlpA
MTNPFESLDLRLSNIETLLLDLKHNPQSKFQTETSNPLNIKEVSKLTSLSVPTLYGYCQRNEIPYQKKGNRLYFFKSDIIDWIKTGKQKTIKELEEETDELLSNNKKGLNYGK